MALDKLHRHHMARVLTTHFNKKYVTAQEKYDLLLRSLEVKLEPVPTTQQYKDMQIKKVGEPISVVHLPKVVSQSL